MKSVYLAGPIMGLSYAAATEWRDEAAAILAKHGLEARNPMRFKQYLRYLDQMPDSIADNPLITARAIFARDKNDVYTCDAVIANLKDSTYPSVGTIMELVWAHQWLKPIIVVLPTNSLWANHAMLKQCYDFVAADVPEAVDLAIAVLL